jgi:hypothetical protein
VHVGPEPQQSSEPQQMLWRDPLSGRELQRSGAVAKWLFRESVGLSVIEFLIPDFWILPQKSNLRQNPPDSPWADRALLLPSLSSGGL